MSRRARSLAFCGVALATAGTWVGPAAAHAVLASSEPAEGTSLARSPKVLVLRFTEDVVADLSSVRVVDASGRAVRLLAPPGQTPADSLAVRLPGLTHGAYRVDWHVFAADDGHVTAGALVFGVGDLPAPLGGTQTIEPGSRTAETATRFAWFALGAGLIGALVVLRLLASARTRSGPCERAARRLFALGALSAAGAILAGAALAVLEARAAAPGLPLLDSLGRLARTRWGVLWAAHEATLAAGIAVCLVLGRVDRKRAAVKPWVLTGAAAALAVGLSGVNAAAGHAASLPVRTAPAIAAGTAHVLAASVWVGGLAGLATLIWTLRGSAAPALVRSTLARFGRLAAASVLLLMASGLYSAGREVGSAGELGSSPYGRLLMAKALLFGVVGALGAANALAFHPTPARTLARVLRRPVDSRLVSPARVPVVLAAELAVAGIVLVVASALASTPPARPGAVAATAPATLTRTADGLLVSLSCKPARPGPAICEVVAAPTRRPGPAPVTGVELRLPGAAVVPMTPSGANRYRAGVVLEGDRLRADVLVARKGPTATVARFAAPPAETLSVPSGELEAPLTTAAVALLLAVAAGIVVGRRGRAPPGGALPADRAAARLERKPA